MIRLINETDPKRIQPKHMANKDILIRDKDTIFVARVFIIGKDCYIYRWGLSKKVNEYDGWAPLPIEVVDESQYRRDIDMYFSAD